MMNNKIFSAILIFIASCFILSCGKSSNEKFSPQDRTTVNISDEERDRAIEVLKQSISINIDTLLNSDNVKMSVLPPNSDKLTDSQTEIIGMKMLQMLSQNGIGGMNNIPGFALTASITPTSTKATATSPQKFLVEYDVNYSVINVVTGDVYATCLQKISGAGSSEEQAANEAIKQIVPNNAVAKMLVSASDKIINWFNENLSTFKSQVSEAEANNNYALALALIQSVPQQAQTAFAFAESRRSDVENKFKQQISNSELVAMKQAILNSNDLPSAEVYAHYSLILPSSSNYKEATEAIAKYEKDVGSKRAADSAQQQANLEAERQTQMELAKMENSRIVAKYTAQASEQAIRLYLSQNSAGGGFWKNLGARIIGAIDGTNWQYRVKDKSYTED